MPFPRTRHERTTSGRLPYALAIVAVVLAASAALAGAWYTWGQESARVRRDQHELATRVAAEVARDLEATVGALESFAQSLAADPGATSRAGFARQARVVLSHGVMDSVVLLPRVTAAERTAFERRLGRPLLDPGPTGLRPAADHEVMYPILRALSRGGSPAAVAGINVSVDLMTEALIGAAEALPGEPLLGPPQVVRLTGVRGAGVYVAIPPDSRGVHGVVVGTMTARDLRRAMGPVLPAGARVQVLDAGRPLVGSATPLAGAAEATTPLGDRTWTVRVAGGVPPADRRLSLWVGLGGLALALAIGALLCLLARRERYARRLVRLRLAEREKAESALRVERDISRDMIAAMLDGVVLTDADGRIGHVNEAFCRITGFSRDELLGRSPEAGGYPFMDPADQPDPTAWWWTLADTGRAEFEAVLRRADGRRVDVLVAAAPLGGEEAEGSHVLAIRDVTERNRHEDELRRERDWSTALLTSLNDGLIVTDADRRVVQVNERFCEMVGCAAEDLVGLARDHWPFLPPEERERARRDGRAARETPSRDVDMTLQRPDGVRFPVAVSSAPLSAAEAEGTMVSLITDRTERERSRRALHQVVAEQAALRRVATRVASETDPEALFAVVAEEVGRLLGAQGGAVARFEGSMGVLVGSWLDPDGPGAHLAVPHGFPLDGETAVARTARTGRASRVDHYGDGDEGTRFLRGAGARTGAAAPVRVAGRLWGSVSVITTEARLPADAELRLERFAELIGLAVANAEARRELAERASHDPLTGLANHRTFFIRLEEEAARARRAGTPLALCLLDLDHFKQLNDTRGHQAGDRSLAEVADAIAGVARAGELVARVGGDEFAWVLPGADLKGALPAAERARAAVRAIGGSGGKGLSLSIGVAELRQARDLGDLVHLADGALYWAKAHGRDRVVPYTPRVIREFSAEERAAHLLREQAITGLHALARAVDARDPDTREHSVRVGHLAALLARARGWPAERAERLRDAALVHDVGKIGVPDSVLFKPGRLTPDEYEVVKGHAALGAEIANEVLAAEQVSWVRGHHERWDGSGYPDRLAGREIPEGARILALADAWDVMRSVRTYKEPKDVQASLAECRRMAGEQFDPTVVRLLLRLWAAGLVADPPPGVDRGPASGGTLLSPPDEPTVVLDPAARPG